MAITKKSLIGKTSTNNSAKNKTVTATGPVTPGKMVPAMRLAKANLQTSKAQLKVGRVYI
jgi:hypothetical protein